jgi:hypothetical protein
VSLLQETAQRYKEEMCHEEIHRRPRLDLADCDPDAHPDCKRSPRVPVELLIRQQRLLMISALGERSARGQHDLLRIDGSHDELSARSMR